MNRLGKLMMLESRHAARRAAFVREYIRELRTELLEVEERRACYFEETGRQWEAPPPTAEQEEGLRFIEELVAEWQATQRR